MKIIYFNLALGFIIILVAHSYLLGQNLTQINGKVIEEHSKGPLIGVNIILKDKLIGTVTDKNGNFTLSTKTQIPFTLVFTIVGYETIERDVLTGNEQFDIVMIEKIFYGQEVVVSASRVEEKIISSPISIETMGIIDIQQSSSANFYDGLYQLKGVDMNVNSLTFRFPNMRGFTGDANYRMNQLVDGIENISPGLSFAAGNMFGLSELDVESVELSIGASSALYGPGGMNGTLHMKSKNPFEYQGLSFVAQTGIMHVGADYKDNVSPMFDISFRYAKAINDKFAFKLTGGYLQAEDWHASDFRDRT
ncbi:MAG: carboxypeptidase-like regulatory domain-containing protein, partial [Cyclobacteriaceae bacterium]|nr:carboxypeptidase-like regulatory domain-containing protein [Cyclobacteriaceae bacterium]